MKSSGLTCSIWRFTAISMVAALALVFSMVAVIIPANPAMAANIEVWNTNDSGAGSLRKAIADSITGGTINFSDTLTGSTITLTSGQLTINKSVTITGLGEANLAISGGNTSRVFHINGSYTVDMSGLTIRNGNTSADGGGLYNDGGNVTMTDCTVSGNTANVSGGGIYNSYGDELTMIDCTVSGNEADNGGGIFNDGGQVTMTDCTVSNNTARAGNGGGIGTYTAERTLEMTNCTISGNNASGDGGGIYNYEDVVTLTNCTISGNTADGDGGGICTVAQNGDTVTLNYCTTTNNTAEGSGGGIFNSNDSVVLKCTIVYGNTAVGSGNDVYNTGTYTYTATESIVGSPNPFLGLLEDNGGPTETHALLAGSPAIDDCITSCTVANDQRGQPRPVDGDLSGSAFCDVGAYEYQQQPVGGIVEPVDRLSLLALWLGLAALMAVAVTIAVVVRRRMA